MFEHKKSPLLPRKQFALRVLLSVALGAGLIAIGLVVGMIGYHQLESMDWVAAFLNSSMILAGMGPVDPMHSDTAKLFAGCYAIFSGVAFPTTIGIIAAPIVHRFLHKLHLEAKDKSEKS